MRKILCILWIGVVFLSGIVWVIPAYASTAAYAYEDSDPKYFNSEIDTYWVQHGGGDPAAWIRGLKGRAYLVHFKDMAINGHEARYAERGEGNMNWPAILDACKEAGTQWHIVEQDRTYELDPFDSLGISLKNLKAMGLK